MQIKKKLPISTPTPTPTIINSHMLHNSPNLQLLYNGLSDQYSQFTQKSINMSISKMQNKQKEQKEHEKEKEQEEGEGRDFQEIRIDRKGKTYSYYCGRGRAKSEYEGYGGLRGVDGLEPWSQNSFNITDYHRSYEQQPCHKKSNPPKPKPSKKQTLQNCCSLAENRKKSPQRHRECKHRRCSNKKINQTVEQVQFNTISTSAQQKIKWQLEMDLMMKRKKKASNLLKMRHFGHMKLQSEISPRRSQGDGGFEDEKTQISEIQALSNIKINQTPTPTQYSHRTKPSAPLSPPSTTIKNLYTVLKSFTYRNQVKQRISQNKQRIQNRNNNSDFTHMMKKKPFIKSRYDQDKEKDKGWMSLKRSYQFGSRREVKEQIQKIFSCRETRLFHAGKIWRDGQIQKLYTQNQSLTKQSYSGQSIKNRLKSLKNHSKSVRMETVKGKQKVQQINFLTQLKQIKKNPQN